MGKYPSERTSGFPVCHHPGESLPNDWEEKTDFNGIILDWVGPLYEKEKDFRTALDFLEEYARWQPVLYAESAAYYAYYFYSYYFFTGELGKVKPQLELFLANPCDKMDETLSFHNALWYWGLHEWAVNLARHVYLPVFNDPNIFDWVAMELALPVLHDSLQKAWENYLQGGQLDLSASKETAKEFGFDMTAGIWDDFRRVFTAPADDEKLQEEMLHPSEKNSHILITQFQMYMHRRGMHFHTASMIINDLYNFWSGKGTKKALPAAQFSGWEKPPSNSIW